MKRSTVALIIAAPVVAALVALSGVSQGWNVADNLQRSKNYRNELNQGEK